MNIIGISAYYHDSAVCLLQNGKIIIATQEERFSRVKHDKSFPINAIKYCLDHSDLNLDKIDAIAFYDNWFLKQKRCVDNSLNFGSKSIDSFLSASENFFNERDFLSNLKNIFNFSNDSLKEKLYYVQHHYSHAASTYYCSPFKESAVITIDGVGEYSTTTIGYGNNEKLTLLKSIDFPNSLGLFYSAFTNYLGFKVNTGEYKLMGLAPYGKPIYKEIILKNILKINQDGSYNLNLLYFNFHLKNEMTNKYEMEKLLNVKFRNENQPIEQSHKDLAASVQNVLEIALDKIIEETIRITKSKNISLAGGVALNCSALGKARNKYTDKNFFIQPAAGDAGGAMGAAISLYYKKSKQDKKIDHNFDVYCGPPTLDKETLNFFINRGCPYQQFSKNELVEKITNKLIDGKIIAICEGKSEWGPRALGARSIVANPMIKNIKNTLNLKIKQREDFRPFAPIISRENLEKLFINPTNSEYMSFVFFLKKEFRDENSKLKLNEIEISKENFMNLKEALIHNDWSARLQTISKNGNLLISKVLEDFFRLVGCPMLINTSFNTRGEPPVLNAKDAFRCFMRSEIDYLVINNFFLDREAQSKLTEEEFDIFDPD